MQSLPFVIASWHHTDVALTSDASFVGGKAVGLFQLPAYWVPSFLVLTRRFHEILSDKMALSVIEELPPDELEILTSFLSSLSRTSQRVLVRSNAAHEGSVATVGAYMSQAVPAELPAVAEAMDRIASQAAPIPMFPLLQSCLEPGLLGHMSNERRVSKERSTWLVEGFRESGPQKIKAQLSSTTSPLIASTESQVLGELRTVAGRLSISEETYHHCEWVWTGTRVWIVQADPRPPEITASAANSYLSSKARSSEPSTPRSEHLRAVADLSEVHWKKLKRPLKFKTLGLPTAEVYILPGDVWSGFTKDQYEEFLSDLQRMCVDPVVVRTDIAEDAEQGDLLLPTSSPSTDPAVLLSFMETTADHFRGMDLNDQNWAFLIARIVKARASAMVYAQPQGQWAQVDALWGFPDGLLHLPHDTYFCPRSTGEIQRTIRHKGKCLLGADGAWKMETVGPPFDWSEVLADSEIRTVARWALEIADDLRQEVQLMVLARIGGERGPDACLPWHFTNLKLPRHPESSTIPQYTALGTIGSRSDLERFRQQGKTTEIKGYLVQPEAELMRDSLFLSDVASLAASTGLPIYFEGSLLGHAYYLMAREGAAVIPLSEAHAPGQLIAYHKLVRDQIPAIIRRSRGVATVRFLDKAEALVLLRQKLIEEAYELWEADAASLVEELADIIEVIDSLREHSGISVEELSGARDAKRAARGGFQDLVFLEETEARPLDLTAEDPGAVPLLLEDAVASIQPRRERTKHPEISAVSVDVSADPSGLLTVTAPAVPPVRQGQRVHRLQGRNRDWEVDVSYHNAQVSIEVRAVRAAPPEEQLSLFPEFEQRQEAEE